jgi:hypothetical protein
MMNERLVDTAMAKQLAEAGAIHGATIVGQPGGWSVVLKLRTQEKMLATQRTARPRLWRSLDRCLDFVRNELAIVRFDGLDATNYSADSADRVSRKDTAERMRHAHEAAAYDKWFRTQVGQAITEANDPNTQWVSQDDAKDSWAKKRAALLLRQTEGDA